MSNYFTIWVNKGTFLLMYFLPNGRRHLNCKEKVPKVINDLKDPNSKKPKA